MHRSAKMDAGERDSGKWTDMQCLLQTFPELFHETSLVVQRLKCLPPMWETWVWSLGWGDPLEKEMVTHSSILAWRIPWTKKPSRLQFTGSQRVGHNWVTSPYWTLPVSGGILVPYPSSGSPLIRQLTQMVTMVPGQGGWFNQCASPNIFTNFLILISNIIPQW